MSYKADYNKIIEAYFNDEIEPYNRNFCFCGTIGEGKYWNKELFSTEEYCRMEYALLSTIRDETVGNTDELGGPINIFLSSPSSMLIMDRARVTKHHNYENALFNGMAAALEVLKNIYISRGEDIEETPEFKKRPIAKGITI